MFAKESFDQAPVPAERPTEQPITQADPAEPTVLQHVPAPRVQTPLRKLALAVEWYCQFNFNRARLDGGDFRQTWAKLVYLLAMFNIQLSIKPNVQKCTEGVPRMTFYVSNGNPRSWSSMRLPADVAAEFMTLDANVRTMASRCFEENAKRMAVEQPFADFQDKEQRLQAEKLLERVVLE